MTWMSGGNTDDDILSTLRDITNTQTFVIISTAIIITWNIIITIVIVVMVYDGNYANNTVIPDTFTEHTFGTIGEILKITQKYVSVGPVLVPTEYIECATSISIDAIAGNTYVNIYYEDKDGLEQRHRPFKGDAKNAFYIANLLAQAIMNISGHDKSQRVAF